MQTALTALEVLTQIDDHAAANEQKGLLYEVPLVTEGQPIPQGDINVWHLDRLPEDIKPVPTVAQLAPGSTRGSRHCIRQQDLVNVAQQYELDNPNLLQGPIFELNGSITIEHPEHDDQLWKHSRYIAITYQRRYSENLRRVVD